MPSADLHEKKANHNKKFLNESIFDIKSSNYLDWHVIACFYYILHLVDKKLALTNNLFEKVDDHKVRRNLINTILCRQYIELPELYTALETYSKIARYKCVKIDKNTTKKAIECMKRIEKLLAS